MSQARKKKITLPASVNQPCLKGWGVSRVTANLSSSPPSPPLFNHYAEFPRSFRMGLKQWLQDASITDPVDASSWVSNLVVVTKKKIRCLMHLRGFAVSEQGNNSWQVPLSMALQCSPSWTLKKDICRCPYTQATGTWQLLWCTWGAFHYTRMQTFVGLSSAPSYLPE